MTVEDVINYLMLRDVALHYYFEEKYIVSSINFEEKHIIPDINIEEKYIRDIMGVRESEKHIWR